MIQYFSPERKIMAEKATLIKIFGDENVLDGPLTLGKYSCDLSFVHSVPPQYIVRPQNSAQVQAVIKLANETVTPLVPISSGFPHFRGDTVPGVQNAIIVDLSSLKRIIHIDSANRVAMIEPGVTFTELQPILKKAGLRLNMPLLPRSTKSVLASALEREPVILPKYQWDIADPLLCTEIIFGSGDLFRTGSAAGPGTLEEQWEVGAAQEIPSGPSQVDWYRIIQGSQGTMGIVNWATIRCERLPSLEAAYLVGDLDLAGITEFIHWLLRLRLVNECLVLNNTNLAAILSGGQTAKYRSLKDSLPPWILLFCIAGYQYYPEERVAYQIEEMRNIAKKAGIESLKMLGQLSASKVLDSLRSPSEEPYWKLNLKGSCHDIFFLTVQDKLREFTAVMSEVAVKYGYSVPDMGVYIQPVVQGTSCHCEFNLFFNPDNEFEVDIVRKISIDAVQTLSARGAFFSRPYGPWADIVFDRDQETAAALKKLKRIFDPNNVMNPGKLCF
jgi:FAD/FMN-containing dehydrogenase